METFLFCAWISGALICDPLFTPPKADWDTAFNNRPIAQWWHLEGEKFPRGARPSTRFLTLPEQDR